MSQGEVGLGEEGRFLKMYKMWEDCWTKLKLKQIHVSFNSRQKDRAGVVLSGNKRETSSSTSSILLCPFF